MLFEILTLFPEAVQAYLDCSILGRARAAGLVEVRVTNIREFTHDRHRTVDDRPYGGGAGMVMKPEPLAEAIGSVRPGRVILTSPRGRVFDQSQARRLYSLARGGEAEDVKADAAGAVSEPHSPGEKLILVCGRYEGVDQRFIDLFVDEELSMGDFILTGGELAALAVIDAVARLRPGVLGDDDSAAEESFTEGLLEYPHYTRPGVFQGMAVPEVLVSGDHARVARWRRDQALKITRWRRPELLDRVRMDKNDRRLLARVDGGGKDN